MRALDNATGAAVARHLHAARTLQVADALACDRVTPALAEDALRITRALARGWAATLRHGRAPLDLWAGDRGGAWDYERLKTLQAFAALARANLDQAPHDRELTGLADAIDAVIEAEIDMESTRRLLAAPIAIPSLEALPVSLPPVAVGVLDAAARATRPAPPAHQSPLFEGALAA